MQGQVIKDGIETGNKTKRNREKLTVPREVVTS